MDCDGNKSGYDIELTRMAAEHVSIPVIASGGAGDKQDFYDVFVEGKRMQLLPLHYFITKSLILWI